MGIIKKNKIELIKYEPKDPLNDINDKINIIQNYIKNINKEIKNKVKDIL